ncbi:hypothetical protein [Wolbachia pipientis]|nr:hypothetical protein [Wolbachia pipientis]
MLSVLYETPKVNYFVSLSDVDYKYIAKFLTISSVLSSIKLTSERKANGK